MTAHYLLYESLDHLAALVPPHAVYGSAVARVARCADLLDAVKPDWFERVDVDALDIVNERACIGFYVYGGYTAALQALDVADPVAWALHPIRTVALGGTATEEEALEDAGALTEAWCAMVRERRGNAARFAQVRGGVTRG